MMGDIDKDRGNGFLYLLINHPLSRPRIAYEFRGGVCMLFKFARYGSASESSHSHELHRDA